MPKTRYSSLVCDSYEGDAMPWSESTEDFGDGEEDDFKMEDDGTDSQPPLKRRQRRQRLHSLHCYVARRGVVAVVASASILTRQVENMTRQEGIRQMHTALFTEKVRNLKGGAGISATFCSMISNFKSSLCCAVGGAVARVGKLATGLANAIGEPPHRVLAREEQDAPLLLFWAINLCALCTIASLALFVLTFSASPVTDISSEPEAVVRTLLNNTNSTQPVISEGKKLEGLFRVLGVVGLSLISGCGLGLRHPIQSALLSGF